MRKYALKTLAEFFSIVLLCFAITGTTLAVAYCFLAFWELVGVA